METVLVTGVAGMLGSHLLDSLLESGKYKVIGVDNLAFGRLENIEGRIKDPNFRFYQADVIDFDTLKILGRDVDVIVHLAAVKKIAEADSSLPTLMVNTKGTTNVLEVAKMWRSRVVFASTSDVYGMSEDLPHNEDGNLLLGPSMIRRWSYATSKLYDEQLCFAYFQSFGLPVAILRYFGGFSARSSFTWSGGHIPIFINAILRDEEVVIHGDGSQTRSMAYVTDLVHGTILAMENPRAIGEIINIGNDEEMSVLESAKVIHELAETSRALKLRHVPFDSVFGKYKDIMRRIPDLGKAKRILGYAPRMPLREAIALTIDTQKQRLARQSS